ncbi:MAG: amidinotransferase [Cyclobacteriaceae bacterium]|nr:amidinotransferase [Cyclobacteriaceae bacterium]
MTKTAQVTSTILMIRPVAFRMNEQTAVNNYYQHKITDLTADEKQEKALQEFDEFVNKLRNVGVEVIVANDTLQPSSPDSIFPNNWVSFHDDSRVVLYPMFAVNRRYERRMDIIEMLSERGFEINNIVDLTQMEQMGVFLEGTGSLILDRQHKITYAAISDRTHEQAVADFSSRFDYTPVVFHANQTVDGKRLPIYHTNVMMSIAEDFAIICADSIDDPQEREKTLNAIKDSGKEVIEISEEQVTNFAGNMLQVQNASNEDYLVMSTSAYNCLTKQQIERIEKYCKILHSDIDTIETLGGGSARCMMAEVFLPKKG